MITAARCTLGIVPHLLAAITGTAALLRASGVAFEVLKLLGVAYLLYLAVSTWRDRGLLDVHSDPRPASTLRTIVNAVPANLLNPKLTLFFFAFLSQFVDASQPALGQMLALGGVSPSADVVTPVPISMVRS